MLTGDGTNLYITAAQFNVNVSGFVGTESWVIGDTAGPGGGLYNGGTLTVTANELTPSNQSVFTVAASSGSKTYYASDYSSGGQILLALQTYDKSTNTFGAISTLSLGNIDQGGAYTVQQKGTSLLLDAVDNRTANIVYANGFLYGVAEMKPIGSSVPLVHWFKVDVSNPNAPALVAQGDISGASIGTNVATFNSSIAVDAAGDVLINFTASGPNNYPSDYYVFQGAGDPTGSFSAPILYQASTGFFDSGDGASVQRWGLNSSTTVDPNNPNSFWLSNEYVANGWWQTSVAQVAIQNIGAPTVASIATSGTGITNGTGDLNAGKVITLTVNFSAAVTVTTTGGSPTLTLNDGGTATYTGGSGTHGAHLQLHGCGRAEHVRPRRLIVQSQRRNREGRSRQCSQSGWRHQLQSGRHPADRYRGADCCLDRADRHGDHQWQRQPKHRPGRHVDRQFQ